MRLIDRYICGEVFSHALLGLAIFTFVFFVPRLVQLMSLVVRPSASWGSVFLLFACSLPPVLIFSLPAAVLVGVLIGLGRLSADSELIALNAVGVGRRRLLIPVGALALGSCALTLGITFWLGPASLRTLHRVEQRLRASQASYEIQPRVFEEGFPNFVLYAQDVEAAATRWHGVFLAELNPATGSQLTLAKGAIVIAERGQGKLQLHLGDGSTHADDPQDPSRYSVTTFAASDLSIEVADAHVPGAAQLSLLEQPVAMLLAARGPSQREARVEFHRRLAFPLACAVFALVAVPIAARPRRGGRAAGFVLTLLLLSGYYLLFISGVGKARQGTLAPWLGVWGANFCTAALGAALLLRTDQIGAGVLAEWGEALAVWRNRAQRANPQMQNGPAAGGAAHGPASTRLGRAFGLPMTMDLYVLRGFLFYFTLTLAGFVVLVEAFTFFELLDDITHNRIPFLVVANYFRYLVPLMLYELSPLAALVATLATLGVMSKNNEITAMKASGVSLYRLAVPLVVAGAALAGALFLLDYTFLPYANQKQDALRNQIKGRPAQTFYQPSRKWIFGQGTKIYNYEVFDPDHNRFGMLNVFELDPESFQMRRRVFAARAQWSDVLHAWVLEEGWVRDFDGATITRYLTFPVYRLTELNEPPSYFKRDVRQSYQKMSPPELREYINELQQAGFDASRLTVQWHEKFAFPLIAPIIVILGVPFAFLVGTRGAVSGLAVAVGIGIVYWAAASLFESMGALGQLPPLLAGWGPDTIFTFLAVYFFLRMPT